MVLSQRQLFLQHIGQTSDFPLMLEIERAENIYMYDTIGKRYIDLISGVSVSNLGHRHPKVVEAIKAQLDKYMHLMVYGEFVQTPQVEFAKLLAAQLPDSLNCTYFVNSGAEAVEGAIKLAKRFTGRREIIAFRNAYHGSTVGAMSLMSDSTFTAPFEPVMPEVQFLDYNNENDLLRITEKTAGVFAESVRGEAGMEMPVNDFLKKLRARCTEVGALLIIDEIQTGFGRLGTLFGFQMFGIVPDIFTIAKGMGGGMPIGAFVSSKEILDSFKTNPVLGHITTFGGHPVCAAAALASLQVILDEKLCESVERKGELFRQLIKSPLIRSINGTGLFLSVELKDFEQLQRFMKKLIELGALTDWFLFSDYRFRITPPLIITDDQIVEACELINKALAEIS